MNKSFLCAPYLGVSIVSIELKKYIKQNELAFC